MTLSGASPEKPRLKVRDLVVHFPVGGGLFSRPRGWVHAVDGVTFTVGRGTTLGLVGESGSGKTTTGRSVVRLTQPRSGSISLDGIDLLRLKGSELRRHRRRFQMVFQDPKASLDPRQPVRRILTEPLVIHRLATDISQRDRVAQLLELVGLDADIADWYPHELSGGQLQRIGIARALAVEPDLIVCDEPVSSLDVSVQAQVVNLLMRLQSDLGLTYVFIAHDLAVVRHIADAVAVMYLGRIVEAGPADSIYAAPAHPYTIALLSAAPVPDVNAERNRRRIVLSGDVPSPVDPPSGCRFTDRCWLRTRLGNPDICVTTEPPLAGVAGPLGSHQAACHFSAEARDEAPAALAAAE